MGLGGSSDGETPGAMTCDPTSSFFLGCNSNGKERLRSELWLNLVTCLCAVLTTSAFVRSGAVGGAQRPARPTRLELGRPDDPPGLRVTLEDNQRGRVRPRVKLRGDLSTRQASV